jgi:general nucleoside transport system permease protein
VSEPAKPAPSNRASSARVVIRRIVAPDSTTWSAVLVVILAFFSALVVSALFIVFSDTNVIQAPDLGTALNTAWTDISGAYGSLLSGALGDPSTFLSRLDSNDPRTVASAFYPISETLVSAAPLIFTGLGVALGFRAGLFNIGGEGQVILGGLFGGFVGFTLHGLTGFIELPLALLAGFAAGAFWGFIPGILKARTGAHEVISTIMLNYVAIYLSYYLLGTKAFQRPGRTDPISKFVDSAATFPNLNGMNLRLHLGVVFAIAIAAVVYILLWRTTLGFEFRAVGANPDASRAAGMGVARVTVLAMSLAGGLAGLAGANIILGTQYSVAPGFSSGLGFDGITVALLGRGNPAGVVAAALLFGGLRAGSVQMQAATSTPVDLVQVIEALVILFVAAPALIRAIYRIRSERAAAAPAVSPGWGG